MRIFNLPTFTLLLLSIFSFSGHARPEIDGQKLQPTEVEMIIEKAFAIETTNFKVKEGKLQNGGRISTGAVASQDGKNLDVQMDYELDKKGWVPIPSSFLRDKKTIQIPKEFATEQGYLNLEAQKEMDLPKATLKYLNRVDLGELKNAHYFEIDAKNGKSTTYLHYHPSLPGLGWAKLKIVLHKIPGLKDYPLEADLETK